MRINSKPAACLFVAADAWPLAVIEYQETGRHRGKAEERNAVKRTMLPRAGIRYLEVPSAMSKHRLSLRPTWPKNCAARHPTRRMPRKAKAGSLGRREW
ncbi:DUF2726 domain-containing protein [Roseomonas chloroacetimidivorans]|uniref:DUF2726 domain-containing protein n=1 Tax=Roseomonas chloroacetimidivorans TaxID=1766656 RepID=UPI003C70EF5E